MIIKLSPKQITENWERLRPMLLANLIPKTERNEETVFRVIQNLLTGGIILWAAIEKGEGPIEERIYGFIATIIETDAISGTRNLLLYSLFAMKHIKASDWKEGLEALEEFKKANNCANMIAYTDVPQVEEIASSFGFRKMTFLIKE